MFLNRLTIFLRVAVLAAALGVAACQSAPVQEMSDARQAIAVAKEAGAEQHAAENLRAAVDYLARAEESLSQRQYDQARLDAVNAKESALVALQQSQQAKDESD